MENLEIISKEVGEVISGVSITTIETDEQQAVYIDILAKAKEKYKKLEELRKDFTSGLRTELERINNKFKLETSPLLSLEERIKTEINLYYKEILRKKEELLLKMKEHSTTIAVVEAPITTIHTESGTTSIKRNWTFEVEDINLVPREYMTFSPKAIKLAIKNGERNIKGIKIYQETSIAFSK